MDFACAVAKIDFSGTDGMAVMHNLCKEFAIKIDKDLFEKLQIEIGRD